MSLGQAVSTNLKQDTKILNPNKTPTKSQTSFMQGHRANRALIQENPRKEHLNNSLPQLSMRTTFTKNLSINKQNNTPSKKIIVDPIIENSASETNHGRTLILSEDSKQTQEKLPTIPPSLFSPKESPAITLAKDNDHARPSFLAPTVAALQHFKDKNTRKDSIGKGFVFSRPKDKINKYESGQMPEEHERARRGIGGSHHAGQPHQSASADRFSSKKSLNKSTRLFQKEDPSTNNTSVDSKIERPANIMTKELETKWGYRQSISDIDEDEENNFEEKKSNRSPKQQQEKETSPKSPFKKGALSAQASMQFKPTDSPNLHSLDAYLKTAKSKSKFFGGNVREKIWSHQFLKKPQLEEKSPQTPKIRPDAFSITSTPFSHASSIKHAKKDDVFQTGYGSFFQFNQDNKFFDSFEKYHKPNNQYNSPQKPNKGTVPVMVSIGQNDRIIQPSYMKDSGSMCVTEFWPKKYNVMFYYHLKDTANHIRVRREGRENEVMYRPSQWEKEDKIKRMNDSSSLHGTGTNTALHPQQTIEKLALLDTSSGSNGPINNSPSKNKQRYTRLWQDSNQDSPTIAERMENYGMQQRASIKRQASVDNESKFSQKSFDLRATEIIKQTEVDLEKFKIQTTKAANQPRTSDRYFFKKQESRKNTKSHSINTSAR